MVQRRRKTVGGGVPVLAPEWWSASEVCAANTSKAQVYNLLVLMAKQRSDKPSKFQEWIIELGLLTGIVLLSRPCRVLPRSLVYLLTLRPQMACCWST